MFPEDAIIFISIFVVTCQLPAAENCLYVIHHQQAPVRSARGRSEKSQILHYLGKAISSVGR
ncbi:MAG: hypothetical protein GDA43_26590 [Hormoscilla sp. SP5CHS1]|nr:hypothetical protein [Hormoscilla sp. SP5CHS1]